MKLKLENPRALDSTNMCMSGVHIRITFGIEKTNEYIYFASNNSYSPEYKIVIERDITPDKMVLVRYYESRQPLNENKMYFQLSTLKNKGEFLDLLVKTIETEYTKNYVVL